MRFAHWVLNRTNLLDEVGMRQKGAAGFFCGLRDTDLLAKLLPLRRETFGVHRLAFGVQCSVAARCGFGVSRVIWIRSLDVLDV